MDKVQNGLGAAKSWVYGAQIEDMTGRLSKICRKRVQRYQRSHTCLHSMRKPRAFIEVALLW